MLNTKLLYFIFSLCLLCGVLQGCATQKQSMRLDDTLNLYASTMRWGDFRGAIQFFSSPALYQNINFAQLKTIKVTGYEVQNSQLLKEGNELRQTVEIRYYDTDVGSEHQLIDRQVWSYHPDKEVWLLDSAMPVFK